MNLWQYAIARRFAQLTEEAADRKLKPSEEDELVRLEQSVNQYEAAEQAEDGRYRPLRPPLNGARK